MDVFDLLACVLATLLRPCLFPGFSLAQPRVLVPVGSQERHRFVLQQSHERIGHRNVRPPLPQRQHRHHVRRPASLRPQAARHSSELQHRTHRTRTAGPPVDRAATPRSARSCRLSHGSCNHRRLYSGFSNNSNKRMLARSAPAFAARVPDTRLASAMESQLIDLDPCRSNHAVSSLDRARAISNARSPSASFGRLVRAVGQILVDQAVQPVYLPVKFLLRSDHPRSDLLLTPYCAKSNILPRRILRSRTRPMAPRAAQFPRQRVNQLRSFNGKALGSGHSCTFIPVNSYNVPMTSLWRPASDSAASLVLADSA